MQIRETTDRQQKTREKTCIIGTEVVILRMVRHFDIRVSEIEDISKKARTKVLLIKRTQYAWG